MLKPVFNLFGRKQNFELTNLFYDNFCQNTNKCNSKQMAILVFEVLSM